MANRISAHKTVIAAADIATNPDHVPKSRRDRWRLFLAIAGGAHAVAFFGCPSIIIPPRISEQMSTVVVAVLICTLPPGCSVFLLLRGRTLSERVVAANSLLVSVFWLLVAWGFIEALAKGR